MEQKYNGVPDKVTEKNRSLLYFRFFIENKIITKQVHDFEGDKGFIEYMTLYLK